MSYVPDGVLFHQFVKDKRQVEPSHGPLLGVTLRRQTKHGHLTPLEFRPCRKTG